MGNDRPQIWDSRVWFLGASAFQDARRAGFSYKAAKVRAAMDLAKNSSVEELAAAIPELERVGSMVFGIAKRSLRILTRK